MGRPVGSSESLGSCTVAAELNYLKVAVAEGPIVVGRPNRNIIGGGIAKGIPILRKRIPAGKDGRFRIPAYENRCVVRNAGLAEALSNRLRIIPLRANRKLKVNDTALSASRGRYWCELRRPARS